MKKLIIVILLMLFYVIMVSADLSDETLCMADVGIFYDYLNIWFEDGKLFIETQDGKWFVEMEKFVEMERIEDE